MCETKALILHSMLY